MAERLLRNAG